MTIFNWFLVGHLLGDWVLQSDWMAQNKRKSLFTKACFTHVTVYTIVLTLVLLAVQTLSLTTLVACSLFVFVTHWLVDATSLVDLTMKTCGQSSVPFLRIMVDQTFHLVTLGVLASILPS